MKRFDRATYFIFLLILMADVARAHSLAPVEGDAGLILSAASQLQGNSGGGAVLAFRRSNSSPLHIAGFRSYRLANSAWSKQFSDSFRQSGLFWHSNVVLGSAWVSMPGANSCTSLVSSFQSASPSLAVFEHSGSPAP